MCWPAPGEGMNELAYKTRYGMLSKGEQLEVASIINAYEQLVKIPERERRIVIRELRKGSN